MNKISKAQTSTLRVIAENGGEMNGYAGTAPGFYVNSLPALVRAGLLERLGTTSGKGPDGGHVFLTYNRHKITEAGAQYLASL